MQDEHADEVALGFGKTINNRRDLVFIHGSGGNRAVWAYQSRHFSRQFNVVAVDLPGHGTNKGEGRSTVAGYANYVAELINQKSLASPVLVGHSLGGAIALRLALDMSAQVGGIVLVGTGGRLRVLPTFFEAIRTDFAAALETIGDYGFSPSAPRDLVAKALAEMKKGGPEVLYNDFAACDNFDVISELSHIDVPNLVVVGRDDRLTPVKYAEFLHKSIAGSKIEIIDRAGHMVMLEQPEAFNDVVDRFLRNL